MGWQGMLDLDRCSAVLSMDRCASSSSFAHLSTDSQGHGSRTLVALLFPFVRAFQREYFAEYMLGWNVASTQPAAVPPECEACEFSVRNEAFQSLSVDEQFWQGSDP